MEQVEIRPGTEAESSGDPGMKPVESHEDGCSCEHDSTDEICSCEHDSSAEMKETGPPVENCGNGGNEPDPASTNLTQQPEEKNNSVLLRQEEQCSQEQNQQMKEEAMQETGQSPAPATQDSQGMAEAQGGQSAAPAAPGQTPQQPQQAQPQQQAAPQAQPQQQAAPQAQPLQQAAVDPAAYAAWQQAVWQQQMAAAQAQAMQPGYPYAAPHMAVDPGMARDSSANPHHPKHDAHKYGQIVQMAEKFVNGETDLSDVVNGISLLENQDSQFWRGLLVGGVATLVLTSDQVKNAMARLFQPSEADE